jgi:hypothetical protein
MNDRIRELANQVWAEEYWDNPNTDKLLPAQLNRFAKLIVSECMDVLDPGQNQVIARFQARQWLAEHFGIKE